MDSQGRKLVAQSRHFVALFQAQARSHPCRDLQGRNDGANTKRVGQTEWSFIPGDRIYSSVLANKDHVERQDRVFHLEINDLRLWEFK
jgi:hypothetical protein